MYFPCLYLMSADSVGVCQHVCSAGVEYQNFLYARQVL